MSSFEPFSFPKRKERHSPTTWTAVVAEELPRYRSLKILKENVAVVVPDSSSDDDDAELPLGSTTDPLLVLKGSFSSHHPIDSAQFDPMAFLKEHHSETSYEQLLMGRKKLAKSLRSEETQIKQLVANNFDKFVQSKDTIDTVVAQIASHADTDEKLAAMYGALGAQASSLYRPILDKLKESSRLQSLLALTERFQFLLSLPARVRRRSSLAEKEAVLRDFEKARRLVRSTDVVLFHNIFDEIEAQLVHFCHSLYADLAQLDLNKRVQQLERIIRLIDDIRAAITEREQRESEASMTDDDDGRQFANPALFYLARRCESLNTMLRSASLQQLHEFTLTNEIEFCAKYVRVIESELSAFEDNEDDGSLTVSPQSHLAPFFQVLDTFCACASASPSPLAVLSSLIGALRTRKRPGKRDQGGDQAGNGAGTLDEEEDEERAAERATDRPMTADVAAAAAAAMAARSTRVSWDSPEAARLARVAEQYVRVRSRSTLDQHVDTAFDAARARIAAMWNVAEPNAQHVGFVRHQTTEARRAQRQLRYETSLQQSPIDENVDLDAMYFFARSAAPPAPRELRSKLRQARRVMLVDCFRPLHEALPLLSVQDVSRMRERVVDALRLLINLLDRDAADDDSGLRMLATLATLVFVRTEFATEVLGLFRAQFAQDGETDHAKRESMMCERVPASLVSLVRTLEARWTRSYVRLQLAPIDAIIVDGLLRAGTNWFYFESRRGDARVNDYVVKVLLRLVATHDQVATRCPALLDDVVSRLLDGALASIVATLPSIECFDAAGLLQLRIDVEFLVSTLERFHNVRSKRMLDCLERHLKTAADDASATAYLSSAEALAHKQQAISRTKKSTRVLFLCFE